MNISFAANQLPPLTESPSPLRCFLAEWRKVEEKRNKNLPQPFINLVNFWIFNNI